MKYGPSCGKGGCEVGNGWLVWAVTADPEVLLHHAIRARLNEIDGIDRAVIATQPDGSVVHWNSAAELLYGWTAQEAVGRNIVELTPGELSRGEATDIMSVLAAGEPWSGEFLVRTKSGARFTAHVVDIPVLDEAGTLVGIIGLSRRSAYLENRPDTATRND
jgi:PAS domain S-box-containing protein